MRWRPATLGALVALALACSNPFIGGAQQLLPNEVHVNGELEGSPQANLSEFLAQNTWAFVGQLQGMNSEFMAGGGTSTLVTRLVFQPTEVLKGTIPLGSMAEVWTSGGTYLNTPNGQTPRGVADRVSDLQVGSSYLVVAEAGWGRQWVAGRALVCLDGSTAVGAHATGDAWPNQVIAAGRSQIQFSAPGSNPTDRDAFLHAVRAAITP